MNGMSDYITTKGAARLLGVSPATVVRYANDHRIPCIVLPSKHRRFHRPTIEAIREEMASSIGEDA